MKGKILLSIVLVITFLGITFLLNQKFKSDVRKNQQEIEKIEKTEEKIEKTEKVKKKTYKDEYLSLLEKSTGKKVDDEVYQYISVNEENKVKADFILTSSGNLYLGFPNYDDILPEKITQNLEAYDFTKFITYVNERDTYHIFIGKKIRDNISTIFLMKIDDDKRTLLIFLTKDRHMGYVDVTDVPNGKVDIMDLPFEDTSYVLQSKEKDKYQVILVQRSGNRINISQNLVKK